MFGWKPRALTTQVDIQMLRIANGSCDWRCGAVHHLFDICPGGKLTEDLGCWVIEFGVRHG